MALTNFTIPFGGHTTHHWATTVAPLQPYHASAVNNLLYGPAGHQTSDDPTEYYKNNPYSQPQQHYQSRRRTSNNNYLPPPPPPSSQPISSHLSQTRGRSSEPQSQYQQQQQPSGQYLPVAPPTRPYTDTTYNSGSAGSRTQYFNGYNTQTRIYHSQTHQTVTPTPDPTYPPPQLSENNNDYGNVPNRSDGIIGNDNKNINNGVGDDEIGRDDPFPERPPGFTRVQAGQGSRTQVHAVLDYDVEEGEEDYNDGDGTQNLDNDGKKSQNPTVTPIQGPIFVKNGTVPVVPLFSYPTVNNGSFIQIPIWWTALSVALGLDIRGDVIRGVPCIKRFHQLFCPTAGNSYPIDKIERFIDDNKALMRRMYGDFEMTEFKSSGEDQPSRRRRRYIDDPDIFIPPGAFASDSFESVPDTEAGETYFGKLRKKRQSSPSNNNNNNNNNKNNKNSNQPNRGRGGPNNTPNPNESNTGRVDACESKIEIVTPYWASNSAGKIRAIVNTQHFEQAIHQEICTKVQTRRCGNDCGCEQKYKWHRLLAYDPDNDCKGIFMDWFLFPSCCVCRCNP